MNTEFKIDPKFKNLIPPLSHEEFDLLEQSCLAEGIRDAIVTWQGFIIDGHNRYSIAQKHGLEFESVEKQFNSAEDVICWMVDNQLGRRNLTDFVRYELVAKKKEALIEKGKVNMSVAVSNGHQGLSIIEKPKHSTEKVLAESLSWSTGKLAMAEKVAKKADSEVKELLRQGQVTINQAYQDIKRAEREEKQRQVMAERAEVIQSFDELHEFELIYIDPPWRYDHSKAKSRDIENHYPTMSHQELLDMKIPAAKNCVMFMWATAPKLSEAMDLLKAWQFEYKTNAVWDKEKIGMGYWFRGQHELLLVAVKGKVSTPLPEHRFPSVIREARGKHSAKPLRTYEILEAAFPHLTKVEIFSRNKREGWSHYGNEQI